MISTIDGILVQSPASEPSRLLQEANIALEKGRGRRLGGPAVIPHRYGERELTLVVILS